MTTDQTTHQSQHQKFDIVFFIWLFKSAEELFSCWLRVIQRINWQEISTLVNFVPTGFLSLRCFDSSLEFGFFGLCHNTTFVLGEKLVRVLVRAVTLRVWVVIVVKNKEEFASSSDYFGVGVFDTLPDSVDSLIVIPNMTLVQFNHDIQRSSCWILIRVLQKSKNEILQFFVDNMIFAIFI